MTVSRHTKTSSRTAQSRKAHHATPPPLKASIPQALTTSIAPSDTFSISRVSSVSTFSTPEPSTPMMLSRLSSPPTPSPPSTPKLAPQNGSVHGTSAFQTPAMSTSQSIPAQTAGLKMSPEYLVIFADAFENSPGCYTSGLLCHTLLHLQNAGYSPEDVITFGKVLDLSRPSVLDGVALPDGLEHYFEVFPQQRSVVTILDRIILPHLATKFNERSTRPIVQFEVPLAHTAYEGYSTIVLYKTAFPQCEEVWEQLNNTPDDIVGFGITPFYKKFSITRRDWMFDQVVFGMTQAENNARTADFPIGAPYDLSILEAFGDPSSPVAQITSRPGYTILPPSDSWNLAIKANYIDYDLQGRECLVWYNTGIHRYADPNLLA